MTQRKKHIEKSWQAYRRVLVERGLKEEQITELRQAFFAGSAILYQGIMMSLSAGEDASDDDMEMMSDMAQELHEFGKQIDRRYFGENPIDFGNLMQ